MRTRPILIILLAGATAVAGCGTKTIDDGKAEKAIKAEVARQAGADVRSVSCPDDVEPEKGGTFTCRVTGTDGSAGDVNVTQKDDEGRVRFSAPFIHMRDIERSLAVQFSSPQVSVTLDCPEIVTAKAGGTFVCDGRDSKGRRAKIDVTQKDARGNVTAKVRG